MKLVAIDFDMTLVSLHLRNDQRIEIAELAKCIRPFFQEFVPLAVNSNILIAIVTFSKLVDMISSLLRYSFGEEIAASIVIRGNDETWQYVGSPSTISIFRVSFVGQGCMEGKQKHMASAAEFLSRQHCVSLSRSNALLIDDDVDNVNIALNSRVRALRCDPGNPHSLVHHMLSLT